MNLKTASITESNVAALEKMTMKRSRPIYSLTRCKGNEDQQEPRKLRMTHFQPCVVSIQLQLHACRGSKCFGLSYQGAGLQNSYLTVVDGSGTVLTKEILLMIKGFDGVE
jgi:hypothetical protein